MWYVEGIKSNEKSKTLFLINFPWNYDVVLSHDALKEHIQLDALTKSLS